MNKKIILFLASIFACISIFFIVQTYAKYLTNAEGTASIGIARWNIKVNNQSIKGNSSLSTTLVPTFEGNAHIAAGIIAPTAEGYFDLVFDFTAADVSFTYEIEISSNEDSVVDDLAITGYSIDGGTKTLFGSGSNTISQNILYMDNVTTRTIRVYIMWDDTSENAIMNNVEDTEAAKVIDGKALVDVKVSFTQTTI